MTSFSTYLLSVVTEDLAVSSLMNAESSGRTSILLSDIVLGLIDLGFDVSGLNEIPRKRMYRGCKERMLTIFFTYL